MKTGLLEVRPIFLRKNARTEGHVFVSMLALKVARRMENSLRKAFGTTEQDGETIESSLSALSRICLNTYDIAGRTVLALPKTDSRQTKILEALNVELAPPRICTQ